MFDRNTSVFSYFNLESIWERKFLRDFKKIISIKKLFGNVTVRVYAMVRNSIFKEKGGVLPLFLRFK
jgi:hypothetical protein